MPIRFSIAEETGPKPLHGLEMSVEDAYRIHFATEQLHGRWGPLLDPMGRSELTPERIGAIIQILAEQRFDNGDVYDLLRNLMQYPRVIAEGV